MAVPTNQIYLRSPYYVGHSEAGLDKILVDIYIYTGTLTTDKPSTAQYQVDSTAFLNDAGTANEAYIDISELARDYVDVVYQGSEVTNAVWIEYEVSKLVSSTWTSLGTVRLTGLDGYGYFEDEENPQLSNNILMSGDYVVLPEDGEAMIPVLQDNLTGYTIFEDGLDVLSTVTGLTPTENTANVIEYIGTRSGVVSGTPKRIVFTFGGGISDKTVYIRYNTECKYQSVKTTFINRYGALQRMWFFGKSSLSANTTEEGYKRNILTAGAYNKTEHQNAILTKNSKLSMVINTDWYPEESNPTFGEMILSEKVWTEVPSNWLNNNAFLSSTIVAPVKIKNSQFNFKTRLNDKLINYTFNLEFAADRINNVR